MAESLAGRLRALRHYLEHEGVPDDLRPLDDAVDAVLRLDRLVADGEQTALDVPDGCCALCGLPIEPGTRPYREETGWAEPRTEGGTHGLRGRQETGRHAHTHCVTSGITPGQQGLAA